ncbi:MAG: sugar phosphate isomerase/epimerase [Clostridia bacterium]|nr:sugar phosphate isomerase/epimerase [Clostridia bacterium]
MKIATTTGDFELFYPNDCDRIRALHEAGFKYIDLSMYEFTPDSPYMQENWREEVQKIKELADGFGMKFVQAHSQGGNPLSENKAEADFILDATIRSIEICQMLGIKNTVVHSGFGVGLSKEEWFEKNKAFYAKLFPVMEKCGVCVLCENSTKANMGDMYFINSGKDMYEFIKFVDHPLFHGCWDTGHANCEGSQYDEIMAIGEELYAIHYNDNRGMQDEHLIPFLGTLNHDEIINALLAVGFKGYFTLECGASLRPFGYWLGERRPFDKDNRLAQPPLFMQNKIEAMLYETAKYLLDAYGLLEE